MFTTEKIENYNVSNVPITMHFLPESTLTRTQIWRYSKYFK